MSYPFEAAQHYFQTRLARWSPKTEARHRGKRLRFELFYPNGRQVFPPWAIDLTKVYDSGMLRNLVTAIERQAEFSER